MVVGRESEGETEVSVQMRRETGERMALIRRRVWEGIVNYRGRRGQGHSGNRITPFSAKILICFPFLLLLDQPPSSSSLLFSSLSLLRPVSSPRSSHLLTSEQHFHRPHHFTSAPFRPTASHVPLSSPSRSAPSPPCISLLSYYLRCCTRGCCSCRGVEWALLLGLGCGGCGGSLPLLLPCLVP